MIAPKLNQQDIDDIPEHLRKDLEFIFVDRIEEVLDKALEPDGARPRRRAGRAPRPRVTGDAAPAPGRPRRARACRTGGAKRGSAATPARKQRRERGSSALSRYGAVRAGALVGVRAQRARLADRADLGDVAAERQADRPVHHRAHLARVPGIWLMW